MAQSIGATVANLYTACKDVVYAAQTGPDEQPVQVAFGDPGKYPVAAIVVVPMDVRMPVTRPTMGTGRSREQTAEIDLIISVFVGGGEEAQPLAIAAALDLQGLIESHFRTSPNETLTGACREAHVSNARLVPNIAYAANEDPEVRPVAIGRTADITVTVTASIRY